MTRCTLSPRQRMLLEAADVSDAVAVRKRVMLSATDASLCGNSLALREIVPHRRPQTKPKDGQLVRSAPVSAAGCAQTLTKAPQAS